MKTLLNLLLVALIASPLLAGEPKKDKKGEKKAPPCPAAQRVEKMLEGVKLTDEQNAKLDAVKKEFGPKLAEALKSGDVLTADQKKAGAEAAKKAKEAGKKGKEASDAVAAAVKLTDEQKAKLADAKKKVSALEKGLKDKVLLALNDDQKEQLEKKAAPKKTKK